MFKRFGLLTLASMLIAPMGFAQEGGQVERELGEIEGIYDSKLRVTPQVGALGYSDATNNYTARITEGFTVDWNLGDSFNWGGVQLGLQSGFLFSHLGAPDSNFFGTDSDIGDGGDANSFLVPVAINAGYNFGGLLVSGNIGTNLIYQSRGDSMQLGRGGTAGDDSVEFFPSLGIQAGVGVSDSVGISLRGDYIPTPVDDLYTATLGATFKLVS